MTPAPLSSFSFASIPVLPTSQHHLLLELELEPEPGRFRGRWKGASSRRAQKCVGPAPECCGVRRKPDQGRFNLAFKSLESSIFRSSLRSPASSRQSHGGRRQLSVQAKGDVSEEFPKTALRPLSTAWFIDAYHQYKAWPEVHKILSERNVQVVSCREAHDLAQSGAATLIDVREAQDFEKVHAEGSSCAPLFRLIEGDDFKANLRRFGYALLTDFAGTERNPNFIDQAMQAVSGDTEKLAIVLCEIGGTLSTFVERKGPKAKKFADPERRFGRASRSLKALYELQEAGFKKVVYLEGGLNLWIHEDLPLAGTAT